MLRPEPRPAAAVQAITTQGRRQRSTRREATMPTTPGCQPSPATTIAAACACGAQRALGREQDARLGLAAVAVQQVELAGHLRGALVVLGEQQLERGVGPLHPPGGVDPRRRAGSPQCLLGDVPRVHRGHLA